MSHLPKVFGPPEWAVTHAPAANTQATATKAAEADKRHVCTGFRARIVGGTTAPTAVAATVHFRDGAAGAGTPLMSFSLVLAGAIAAKDEVSVEGLRVIGTLNTAMTIEFAAAGGANTFESVAMNGYTLPVVAGGGI